MVKCGETFFWLGNGCLIWIWAPFMHFLDGLKRSATRWRHRLLPKAIEMSLIFLHLHLIEVEHFASYFNGDWNFSPDFEHLPFFFKMNFSFEFNFCEIAEDFPLSKYLPCSFLFWCKNSPCRQTLNRNLLLRVCWRLKLIKQKKNK